MTRKKPNPAWKPLKPKGKPAGRVAKAVAAVGVLKADAAYDKAVRSGDRKAVTAAASRMRTAQRRAGHTADPTKLASVADAVKARAAYDKALASGDARAIKAAGTKLARFQQATGDQDRDRRGRFT